MATQSRDLLELLFRAAVGAAHPSHCLPPNLPEQPQHGRLIVLAAGKGAGSLTEVAEAHYLARMPQDRLDGIASKSLNQRRVRSLQGEWHRGIELQKEALDAISEGGNPYPLSGYPKIAKREYWR